MILGDFHGWIEDQVWSLFLMLALAVFVIKRVLNSNPEIKDEAKKAATKKSIDLMRRFLS
jgi:hypothetical protein